MQTPSESVFKVFTIKKFILLMIYAPSMEIEDSKRNPRLMWIAISLALLLIIVSLSLFLTDDEGKNSDGDDLEEISQNYQLPGSPSSVYHSHPNVISEEFTDLSMIEEISKFRSSVGHDFSNFGADLPEGCNVNIGNYFATVTDEPKSSMKHYFLPYEEFRGDMVTVPVYAPFDGEITRVSTEKSESGSENHRVEITSKDYPEYTAVIFHIDLVDNAPQSLNDFPSECTENSELDDTEYETLDFEAGDLLGYADLRDHSAFDIAILWTRDDGGRQWLSMFELLPLWIIDTYYTRGHDGSGYLLDDFTFTRSYRENNTADWDNRDENDWVKFPTTWRYATVTNGSDIWTGDCSNIAENLGNGIKHTQTIRYEDLEKTVPEHWTNRTYNEAGNLLVLCYGSPSQPYGSVYLYSYEENREVYYSTLGNYNVVTKEWESSSNYSKSYDEKFRVISYGHQWNGGDWEYSQQASFDDDSRISSIGYEEWGEVEYSNTTRDEFGRIISEVVYSSWDYEDEGESYTTSYEYDSFSRVVSRNEHYVDWSGDYFENRSALTLFSYQEGYMIMEISNTYAQTDQESRSCTTLQSYQKSIERKENPYHDGLTDVSDYDLLFSDYLLLSRYHSCDDGDWFSNLEYTYLENSDLVLQELQNETTSNGVNTLSWTNYTYSTDESLKTRTYERTINGTVDNSSYGKTLDEYEYNSSDENRIVVLKYSYSSFNYTNQEFDGVHQIWNVYDAFGNRVESSAYNHNSEYEACSVYVWE